MTKTLKRVLAVLLSVLMLTTLMAGCGGDKDESSTPDASGETDSTVSTDATEDVDEPTQPGDPSQETPEDTTAADSTGAATTAAGGDNKPAPTTPTKKPTPGKFDISKAPMPSRKVSAKELTYFSWSKMEDEYGKSPKSMPNLFKKEFGISMKGTFAPHDSYWEDLAKLKAVNKAPDLVKLPNWNFYPLPITEELIQPLDSLIDFSNPMWDDTKTIRENNKWKGKTYVPFLSENLQTWFIYNTRMFRDYGLSNRTPRAYYEGKVKGKEWTWDVMEELANKFVKKDAAGEATQFGLTMQTGDLIATTGLELVTGDGKGGYVYNLKDPKIASMMNMFYRMGANGTKSLYTGDAITGFNSGKVAMIITNASTLTNDFSAMRKKGTLDWVPMPKMDAKSPYYNQSSFNPGWAIPVGAKNPQEAALFIEYMKWFGLGYNFCSQIPTTTKNAATLKYNLKASDDGHDQLNAEEAAWCQKIMDKNYKNVTIMWQSWLGTQVLPGYGTVTSGAKKWSAAVEEEFPATDALLQSYVA